MSQGITAEYVKLAANVENLQKHKKCWIFQQTFWKPVRTPRLSRTILNASCSHFYMFQETRAIPKSEASPGAEVYNEQMWGLGIEFSIFWLQCVLL